MLPFNPELLYEIETEAVGEETLEGMDGCDMGVCPVR